MPDDIAYEFYRGLVAQPDCTNCPLRGSKIVPPEGNPRAKIAIIGEGPGHQEEMAGAPFQGQSGVLLNNLLLQAGISRSEVWISNTSLCRSKTVEIDGKVVTPDQIVRISAKHCKSRLDSELAIIRPRVIIGLGAQSVRSVYAQNASLKGRRGAIHTIDLSITDRQVDEEEDDLDEEQDDRISSSKIETD